MSLTEALKKVASAGKMSVIDIGKAVNVREDKALCDVEISGKATALNARLTMGEGENLWFVPKEGSDVIVAWVDGVVPVVVSVLSVEKAIWKGEDFFKKMNEFIEDYKNHSHSIAPGANAGGYPLTATIQSVNANIEEFKE